MTEAILLRAARALLERLGAEAPIVDGWRPLAQLYCAAVEQMASTPAREPNRLDERVLAPFRDLAPDDRRFDHTGLRALAALAEAIVTVGAPLSQRQLADVGAELVEGLGEPLHDRLCHLISEDAPGVGGLFDVELGGARYRLVPTYVEGRGTDDSLGKVWGHHGGSDGWDPKRVKVRPPLVRPIPHPPDAPPTVLYLSKIAPDADRRVGQLTATDGLTLAAIPLLADLAFEPETLRTDRDGNAVFRMREPSPWPHGWQDHLREQIRRCSAARVAVAALPELSGSDAVAAVAREALAECTNGFPILLCLGSWHVDEGAGFVNRLTVITRGPTGGVDVVLEHDKFEPFAHLPYVEGNTKGRPGLTYLVTRAGLFAFGICKDWFLGRPTAGPTTANELNHLCPQLAVCPMMTLNTQDLTQTVASTFKGTRTILLAANACGTMHRFADQQRCLVHIDGRTEPHDWRSVIAAPRDDYALTAAGAEPLIDTRGGGICAARAACCAPGDAASSDNTVFARVILSGG